MNTYIGPNGGSWNQRRNWSDNSLNFNTDCKIDGKTVIADVADGEVGPVGALYLVNGAKLQLTGSGTPSATFKVGLVKVAGGSSIEVGGGWWQVWSGPVTLLDTSSLTVNLGAFWYCSSTLSLYGSSSFTLQSFFEASEVRDSVGTTITLEGGSLIGADLHSVGTLNLTISDGGNNASSVQGVVEIGGTLVIDTTTAMTATLLAGANLTVLTVPQLNLIGSGSAASTYFILGTAYTLTYIPFNVTIFGKAFLSVGVENNQNAQSAVVVLRPGSLPSNAPANLTARPLPGLLPSILLTWTTVAGATTYTVYRSTSSGAETSYQTGVVGSRWGDTFVTGGNTYYYQVTAISAAGESGKSNEASATV